MITEAYVIKLVIYITAGLLGMLYAYSWKWAEEAPKSVSLWSYLTGDSRATVKAILVFIATCVPTIGLDYLNILDTMHLVVAGVGIGTIIPQKVEQISLLKKNRSTDA